MDICIQILDAILAQLVLECSLALPSLIATAIAALIIQTIAVYIHVIVLAAIARTVEIDGSINVATVCKGFGAIDAISESPCKVVVAFSRLVLLEWRMGSLNAKSYLTLWLL